MDGRIHSVVDNLEQLRTTRRLFTAFFRSSVLVEKGTFRGRRDGHSKPIVTKRRDSL